MRQAAGDGGSQKVGRDAWLVCVWGGLAPMCDNVISQGGFHSLRAVMKTYHFVPASSPEDNMCPNG